MPSRRVLKVAEAIRKVVSMAIHTELRDPRIGMVTVTGVEVAGDLRTAKVKVSIMGNDKAQRLGLSGLQNAAGFLQAKINDKIDLRFTPKLTFELDQGIKKSLEVARVLQEVLPKSPVSDENAADMAAETGDDGDDTDIAGSADAEVDADFEDDDDEGAEPDTVEDDDAGPGAEVRQ